MVFEHLTLDEERALYGLCGAEVVDCTFDGPADGESALKECRDVYVRDTVFRLRYPLWHDRNATLERVTMTDTCRAALWYDDNLCVKDSTLGGIKALRECSEVKLSGCTVTSQEFGWFCRGVEMCDSSLTSEYPFLHSENLTFEHLTLNGKYSFQYVKNATFENCDLATKDAFWHSENVTVKDSVIRGEYLGWYSKNLSLVRCRIVGTQPLCYAENLTLVDCEMVDADLAFENSTVNATVRGKIDSIKSPAGVRIEADEIGAVVTDKAVAAPGACDIVLR